MNSQSNYKRLFLVPVFLLILSFFSIPLSFSSNDKDFSAQDVEKIKTDKIVDGDKILHNDTSNISSGEGKYRSSQSDTKFKTIEDGEDVWSWNSNLIRHYQKSSDIWTYYRAPVRYAQLEIRWDKQSRNVLYFLDGNQITADEAKTFTRRGSGFEVGSKVSVGEPRFSLQKSSFLPDLTEREKKKSLKKSIRKLKDQYRQKYQPKYWQFSALASTNDSLWAAVRPIPRRPEPINRFVLPNGITSPRHYRESSAMPTQGGILRIDKCTGEYTRFIEENGLPEKLICRPHSKKFSELPHFLGSQGYLQEVIDIISLEDGRIRFTTRSHQQVVYDSGKGKWEDAQ